VKGVFVRELKAVDRREEIARGEKTVL